MNCVLFNDHLTNDGYKIVEILLNAEKSLNALSFEMVVLIQTALDKYKRDDSVIAIILDGSGDRAFCAGGDVVNLYHNLQTQEGKKDVTQYFAAEYRLDYIIHTFPKPIIAWGSGIVMGGGLGLLAGCQHRVVTDTTMIAMPEVTIGLYPDVGASWFLNKCPGRTGVFLGMTGQRINGADAKYLGIADRLLANIQREELIQKLNEAHWQSGSKTKAKNIKNHKIISNILRGLEQGNIIEQTSLVRENFDTIQEITDVDDALSFEEKLLTYQTDDVWINKAKSLLRNGSPLSKAIIYRQLQTTKMYSLKEAFESELALSVQCCVNGDFSEGVRALLIDKDNKPDWKFNKVKEVGDHYLDGFFINLLNEDSLLD